MTLDRKLADRALCYLETIGRVTGRPHVIEMWFAPDPARDRLYMMAGGRDEADWVRNVRHDGRVRIRLGKTWLSGRAAVIEGTADEPMVRRLLAAKYQGWTDGRPLSHWAQTALPVAMELDG
ncbi:MAG TPA: nitroreductase/quinone reductase family protein [Candidatus Limnocylindrales bacterium]